MGLSRIIRHKTPIVVLAENDKDSTPFASKVVAVAMGDVTIGTG